MDNNTKALSLYRSHGFERISRRENYPEIGTASYRMVKRFDVVAADAAKQSGNDNKSSHLEKDFAPSLESLLGE